MKRMKRAAIWMLAAMFVAGNSFSGMAAKSKEPETRTPILSVALNVTSIIESGDESPYIDVTANTGQYSLGNIDWGSVPTDGYKVGAEPSVKIYLHARSGYYFDKSVSKKTVVVNGAELSNVKKDDDDETLIVTVKLKKVSGTLDDPELAEWVGYPIGKATWDKVTNAKAYELKLYRDGSLVYSVEKCVGITFDFFPYMTYSGTYQFRVRAVPVNSEEEKYLTPGDWVYSDEMDINQDETANARYNDGTTTKNTASSPADIGWTEQQEGWKYRLGDGSFIQNTWQVIDGKWYYFGYDGLMLTGWQQIGGNTYYLSPNGDMQAGWLQYERDWYFLNPASGARQTGWCLSNGKWYYMNPSAEGRMYTGWLLLEGKWYYLDPNDAGAMAVNRNVGGYHLNQDGVLVS